MKTNLSSQIKLDRIPKRYYAPDGELELAALTRDEKVYTKIFEGSEEGSVYVAHDVAELIQGRASSLCARFGFGCRYSRRLCRIGTHVSGRRSQFLECHSIQYRGILSFGRRSSRDDEPVERAVARQGEYRSREYSFAR